MTVYECIMVLQTINNVHKHSKGGITMLTEERFDAILRIVDTNGSVTNQELVNLLGASESTIRRDITALAAEKRLIRVHGGAISLKKNLNSKDFEVDKRRTMYAKEKKIIGEYAASLVEDGDLIYIDAGTTTEFMVKCIPENKKAIFVPNAVSHAVALCKKRYDAYIPGGRIKPVTEAVVGSGALMSLRMYNFNKGFFGANGIEHNSGITTPGISEAAIKEFALSRCQERFILADSSKFDAVSSVCFASLDNVRIITEKIPLEYEEYDIIKVK